MGMMYFWRQRAALTDNWFIFGLFSPHTHIFKRTILQCRAFYTRTKIGLGQVWRWISTKPRASLSKINQSNANDLTIYFCTSLKSSLSRTRKKGRQRKKCSISIFRRVRNWKKNLVLFACGDGGRYEWAKNAVDLMSFVSFICIFRVCNLCKFIQGQYYSKTFNSSASCSRSLIECVKIVNAIDERKPVFNSFFFLTLSVLMDRTIHFCINWFLLLLFLRKVKVISILFFTLILF